MFWRNKPFLKHCFYSNKLSKAEKFPRRGVPKFSRKHFTTVSETKTVINYRVTYLYVIVKYAHNNLNTSIHLENAYFLINRLIDIKHIIWNLSIYNLPRRSLIYHGLYKYTIYRFLSDSPVCRVVTVIRLHLNKSGTDWLSFRSSHNHTASPMN